MDDRRVLDGLLGLYVALVVLPAGALLDWWPTSLVFLGPASLVTSVGVTVLSARVRPPDIADRLATLPVAAVTILPPLAYLPVLLAEPPGSTMLFLAIAGVSALLPGIAIPAGGAIVRDRRLRAAATEITTVTVGDDKDPLDDRDWQGIVAVVIGVAALVTAVPLLLGDIEFSSVVSPLTGLVTAATLFAADEETEVTITDNGVGIDRAFTGWDRLAGYRVTDESVALVRPQWYFPDREFDREEIDDTDALIEGLAEFLPRLDDEGRVERVARQRHT